MEVKISSHFSFHAANGLILPLVLLASSQTLCPIFNCNYFVLFITAPLTHATKSNWVIRLYSPCSL
eukprot:scaffold3580_cov78-Skeletonema_dohrnii-CCMP3373.AAC.1